MKCFVGNILFLSSVLGRINYLVLGNLISFNRRFGDEYMFELIEHVLTQLDQQGIDHAASYVQGDQLVPMLAQMESRSRNLVIFHNDVIFNPDQFLQTAQGMSDHKILLFSSQLSSEHVVGDNLQIINWGSDFLLQRNAYRSLSGIPDKDFGADYHWISLANYPRLHRAMSAVMLRGLGWDQQGYVTFNSYLFHDFDEWKDFGHLHRDYLELLDEWSGLLSKGYSSIKDRPFHSVGHRQIYSTGQSDNALNFDSSLRSLYKNSAVEIVNETQFDAPGYHVTEKFLNSVYGFNIPIILGPMRLTDYLEDLGFDMFRDVVDTTHDTVNTPGLRILSALLKNQRLLTDREYAIDRWRELRLRLEKNYDHARNNLHDVCRDKAIEKFSDAVYWLSE